MCTPLNINMLAKDPCDVCTWIMIMVRQICDNNIKDMIKFTNDAIEILKNELGNEEDAIIDSKIRFEDYNLHSTIIKMKALTEKEYDDMKSMMIQQ